MISMLIAIGGARNRCLAGEPSPTQNERNQLNRTIQEVGDTVTINVKQCKPDRRRIDLAFGSITIVVAGVQKSRCLIKYGRETEDPNWNGELPFGCRIPRSVGLVSLRKANEGVDLRSIAPYCNKTNLQKMRKRDRDEQHARLLVTAKP
jgi:hypothetical protein